MWPDGTISATRVWKRFHADRTRPVLRDEVERLVAKRRGQGEDRWRWALRDVDFHVAPGEAVGLFGANGSGKSTLLKILTRVMYPYAGRLEVAGRVGALIEVRAGIHPDLTGRENVYLYGSLLGLKRVEVADRFDDIVEFAELTDAVDRQVKFYSSGMSMRLGFGVAAFLNPHVLLVDEVLAVGDAIFQQKCLNRMRDVLAEGTTLVYVSHDLATVEATCRRGVWLDNGVVIADGPVRETLSAYRQAVEQATETSAMTAGPVRLTDVRVTGLAGEPPTSFAALDISLRLKAVDPESGPLTLGVSEGTAALVFAMRHDLQLASGESSLACTVAHLPLPRGRYYLWAGMASRDGLELLEWRPVASFDVEGPDLIEAPTAVMRLAPVQVEAKWST